MSEPSRASEVGGRAALIVGILAASFNLRAAITSLPPLFGALKGAAGLSAGAEAALAAVPLLSFALCSGLAPALARWLGEERVIGLALMLLAGGLGLRAAAPGAALFPGTVVATCAIALVNVLLPSLIKRRRPDLAGLLIGLYLMSLTGGAVLAAALAVPLFNLAGGSGAAVRLTLGVWALPAIMAAVIWLPQIRFSAVVAARARATREFRSGPTSVPVPGSAPGARRGVFAVARYALGWQVATFMGLQSLSYYATLSWFPTMFADHGISAVEAGNLLALMNSGNAVCGLIVPVLAQRARDQRLIATVAVAMIICGLAGSAFAPDAVVAAFVAVLGLGQGAAFSVAIFLFTARAADGAGAAALSGFSQGTGYLVATAGPLVIGYLHAISGGWAVPVAALLACAAGQLVSGLLAGRALTLPMSYAVIPGVSTSRRASDELQDGRDRCGD